jgi:glycosyltransferase involved in cell wall biosynthesis
MPAPNALTITWPLATIYGYGIYGVNIALQFLRRGGQKLILTHKPLTILLPPLTELRLHPYLQASEKIANAMLAQPDEFIRFPHPVLQAVGNDFAGFPNQDRIVGKPNIGCAAIEHLVCSDAGRQIARVYDKLIAISKFNADFLQSLDLAPVHLCYQGIDTAMFRPGPKSGLWNGRFVVFSGGKFEFRKGQDIIVAAFKRFAAKHPEALLVCAWQHQIQCSMAGFREAGHIQDTPVKSPQGIDVSNWLVQQGLNPQQFIALPFTHQLLMPHVLWEADVALFTNRCEGGTNLVCMEAMACGVPTIISNNTGHKDLVTALGCEALHDQKPVKQPPDMLPVTDWGESSVDEAVAALERIYDDHQTAKAKAGQVAEKIRAWDWAPLNDKFLDVIAA